MDFVCVCVYSTRECFTDSDSASPRCDQRVPLVRAVNGLEVLNSKGSWHVLTRAINEATVVVWETSR